MKLGIDVDITIKAPDGAYVTIPVVPEEITYDDGSGTPTTVSVLNIGNIDFYNGVELDTLSFSSFFPALHPIGPPFPPAWISSCFPSFFAVLSVGVTTLCHPI